MIRSASLLSALLAFTLVHAAEECIDKRPRPMRISARYTSPEGLGYKPGYTTLEGFFGFTGPTRWLPFLDLRGHVFDNGRLAANAGCGLRYLTCSRTYGFNAYYDYRNTHRQHYNQVAAGFETLGRVWDFRLNGYLPVGAKQSRFYHAAFDGFVGNSMYVRATREFAMKGANAEAGLHVDSYKPIPLYFAMGPYYFNGKGASTWGGELRARAEFLHGLISVEGNTSYDHYFHWIGQGQVSLNFSFGRKAKKKCSCKKGKSLYNRSMQRVDRNEIIPVSKQHVRGPAIDPSSGSPYFFVFVDNTSSSLGTFESPYASLATAQTNSSPGQVIYVLPGDGTATNMDAGITLQDSQMLFGAASTHTMATQMGIISIPPFASTQPVITNTASAPVITLANNNTVSGLYIENDTGPGIFGDTISTFTATQNTILGGAVAEGILLTEPSGQIIANNNLFVQTGPGNQPNYAFHLQSSSSTSTFSAAGNDFYCQPNGNNVGGIFLELTGTGAIDSLSVTDSTFACTDQSGPAIITSLSDNTRVGGVTIANCAISNYSIGIEFDVVNDSSVGNVILTNNHLSGQGYAGMYADLEQTATMNSLKVSNTTVQNAVTYGLVTYQGYSSTIGTLQIKDSSFSGSEYGVNPELGGTGALSKFVVSNCDFTDNTYGVYVSLSSTGPVDTCSITSCTFNYNPGAGIDLGFNSGTSMGTIKLSGNTFVASEYGILSGLGGTVDSLTINNSTFLNNQYGLALQHDSNTYFTIENNIFSGNQNAINSNAIPSSEHGVISNNQFIGSSTTNLVLPMLTGTTNFFTVSNNVFTNITGSPIQGFAAQISSAGSILCLDFVGNVATPAMSGIYVPYTFDGSSGTFDTTAESTQANNIGVITTTGSIGSCTGS